MTTDVYDEILLRIRFPGGEWVTVYVDGKIEGASEGAVIINRAPLILHSLQARLESLSPRVLAFDRTKRLEDRRSYLYSAGSKVIVMLSARLA